MLASLAGGVAAAAPWRWRAIAFGGQLVFASRFRAQWTARERVRQGVTPRSSWWLGSVGGLWRLGDAANRCDPLFLRGQPADALVGARNLAPIRRARSRPDG